MSTRNTIAPAFGVSAVGPESGQKPGPESRSSRSGPTASYSKFVASKLATPPATGFRCDSDWGHLFDFQRDLVSWALRRGRAAIFANTGLGKTRMQLTWADEVARESGGAVLILAPLAVAQQTSDEASAVGIRARVARDGSDVDESASVWITNYDRLHRFDPSDFDGVVLDESSVIKHHDSKTLGVLLESFRDHRYKLACTATPAPNDWVELGTHAEFLGVCSRTEMLSEFFVHDGGKTQDWRLKGHARGEFWRWVSSWGALVRHPADLGYVAHRYDLPTLTVVDHVVPSGDAHLAAGMLFAGVELGGLAKRRRARKATLDARVAAAADLVNSSPGPWVVWCDLNAEGEALRGAIPDAREVRGSDKPEHKEETLRAFARGEIRVLVTKPKIAGFGLNWQHCAQVCFVGVTDSWESYYQAVRRCWRFGQDKPVHVHIITSDLEGDVLHNLRRKDKAAADLADSLAAETSDSVRSQIVGATRTTNTYQPATPMEIPSWLKSEFLTSA